MDHEKEKGSTLSAPTKLLLLPDEARVPCYRTLVHPGIPAGLWILNFLETSHEYVVRIIQRIPEIKKHEINSCLVQCGGGYDMLVLINGAPIPPDVSKIPSTRVSMFLTSGSDNPPPTDPSDSFGTIKPRETVWQHFNCQIQQGASGDGIRIYLEAYTPIVAKSEQHDQTEVKRVMRLRVNPLDSWTVVTADTEVGTPDDFAARTKAITAEPVLGMPLPAKTRKPRAPRTKKVQEDGDNGNDVTNHREENSSKKRAPAPKKSTPHATKVDDNAENNGGKPPTASSGKASAKAAKKPKVEDTSSKANQYGFTPKEMISLEAAYGEEVLGDDDETEVEETPKKETPRNETPKKGTHKKPRATVKSNN